MATFNPGSMIDVTRASTFPSTEFIGTCNNTTGTVSVSAMKYGQISNLTVLSANGYDSIIVTDKIATESGYDESWRTYRIYAGVYGYVTNGVLTVQSVWYGSLTTLGDYKYLFDFEYANGIRLLSVDSVDGNGIGTYNLTSSSTLNLSPRRFIIHYLPQTSQSIPPGTVFNGNQDIRYLEAISSTQTDDEQKHLSQRLTKAAKSVNKGLYFPPGTYTVSTDLSDLDVYGNTAKRTNALRSIIKQDYRDNIVSNSISFKSLNDIYVDGIRPAACKKIKNCYIYFPDKTATFTGNISNNQLTVSNLISGFIHIGGTLSGNGVNTANVVQFISGTPGGEGVYTLDTSQELSEQNINLSIALNYFSSDTLTTEADYDITDNIWDLPPIYIPLYVVNPKSAQIMRNKFLKRSGGYNSHTIRIDSHDAASEEIEISYNKLYMPTITGIFNGSNRLSTVKNLKIEWNDVYEVSEEAIAIDGFGNDAGLCPVICNGPITAFSNDANGRLKVSLENMTHYANSNTEFCSVSSREEDITCYVVDDVLTITTSHSGYNTYKSTIKGDGVPDDTVIIERLNLTGIGVANSTYRLSKSFNLGSAESPVTLKMADWKKFYFIFSENTGADGTITEIYDYDSTENTLTLSTHRPASQFKANVNNWGGVHAGFFNGSVKHNNIICDSKTGQNANNTYSTAISMYHNVFNFEISHNTINGYATGITITGGFMLNNYFVLCYGNSVHDNNIYVTNANTTALGIITQYTGLPQRGNRLYNNNIVGKDCVISLIGAEDTVCENNTFNGENCRIERDFPPPSYIEGFYE